MSNLREHVAALVREAHAEPAPPQSGRRCACGRPVSAGRTGYRQSRKWKTCLICEIGRLLERIPRWEHH